MSRLVVIFMMSLGITGCFTSSDEGKVLSFWTDHGIDEEYNLYINDNYAGQLSDNLLDPICGEIGLLDFKMYESEDLFLSVQDSHGELFEIGMINLYSVSTGIKIKPADNGMISVQRDLDDACTLVYLNWSK